MTSKPCQPFPMNQKESNQKEENTSSISTPAPQMPTSETQKMADPPDSPTPRSQCLPYPPGESKLELMPTEVLEKIFEPLSQMTLQSFHDVGVDDLVEANQRAQTDMRSLCLTSKQVDAVARPLLFRNITVSSPANLQRLYETLLENVQLGYYVRQISFQILSTLVVLRDFLPPRSPQCRSLLTGSDEEIARSNRPIFDRHRCDQILSSCYFEILLRTPKVHRLVIRIQPICLGRHGLDGAMAMYTYRPFFEKIRHAVQASLTGEGSDFLPRLTTLQLLGDPYDHSNLFDITVCEPLLRINTLRTIKTFRQNGLWSGLRAETSGTAKSDRAFMNVRVAELLQGTFYSYDYRAMGVLLADVEVLKISNPGNTAWMFSGTSDSRLAQEKDYGEDIDYIQEALTQMKNLRTLSLDFTYNPYWEGTMPAKKAPILASLPKLKTVGVPLQLLFEDCQGTDRNRIDRLMEVFPISLEHLTLIVDIPCPMAEFDLDDDDLDRSIDTWPPSDTLLDFVESLSHLSHDVFPYLQEVTCCYKRRVHICLTEEAEILSSDFTGNDVFGIEIDPYPRLEQLQASLRQQQIRFSVAYQSVECTDC